MNSLHYRTSFPRLESTGFSKDIARARALSLVKIEHGASSPLCYKNISNFSELDQENALKSFERAKAGTSKIADVIIRDIKNRDPFNPMKADRAFSWILSSLERQVSDLKLKKAPLGLIDQVSNLKDLFIPDGKRLNTPGDYLIKVKRLAEAIDEAAKQTASFKAKA